MADEFEFISATDKPALLAMCTPELMDAATAALLEQGYKIHTAATHGDFVTRFGQIQYHVVVVEELFAANSLEENLTLKSLGEMPMNRRRHSTVILIGSSFQTFNPLDAFQHSVHAVINTSELPLFGQLLEKAVADNSLFLRSYRETQDRLHNSKAAE